MFKKLDHVEINTDQPERAIAFYTEVLGFRVRSRNRVEGPVPGSHISIVYLELGGTGVELISYDGMPLVPATAGEHPGYRGMALEVDDMDGALEYLKARGVAVVWGPMVKEDQYARAEILDPHGYHIELRQWFHKETT